MQSTYMRVRRNKKRRSFEFRWSFHDNHGGSPCIHPSLPSLSLSTLSLFSCCFHFLSLFYETVSQGPGRGWEHSLPCETPRTLQLAERKSGKNEMRDMNSWVGSHSFYLVWYFVIANCCNKHGRSLLRLNRKYSRGDTKHFNSFFTEQLIKRLSLEKERMAIESDWIRNTLVRSKKNIHSKWRAEILLVVLINDFCSQNFAQSETSYAI